MNIAAFHASERLLFKPIAIDDAPALHPIWTNPRVLEHLVLEPFRSLAESQGMAEMLSLLPEQELGARWTITEKASRKIMGTLGFHNVKKEHRRAEIGYEMAPDFWGRGFMTEALRALCNHCFQEQDFNRLEAFVNVGNSRSSKTLATVGFLREGALRDYEFARGAFVDQEVFSLLKRDWCELSNCEPC